MTAGLQPAILVAAFLVSMAVGTGVTLGELRSVAARPLAVVAATLAQWLVLPALALGLIALVRPPAVVAVALVLAAACPGAALSNAYVFVAGADVALSVSLTAITTVASALTLPPLLAAGLAVIGATVGPVSALLGQVAVTLAVAVLLPVLLGMALRHAWPEAVARREAVLRRAATAGVVAVVAMILVDQWAPLGRLAGAAALLGLSLAVLAGVAGHLVAAAAGLPPGGRFAVAVELASRNMGIHALVAIEVLGSPEVLAVGVVLFLTQAAVCLAAAAVWRRLS